VRRWLRAVLARTVRRLPEERRGWGEAMLAEFEQAPTRRAALGWALGGLRATRRLRAGRAGAGLAVVTVALLSFGSLLGPIAWFIGLLLLWRSPIWSRPDKLVAALLTLGPLTLLVMAPLFPWAMLVGTLIGPPIAAVYLATRLWWRLAPT
jgi:hypothetical protein